ncbi:hypothetical protein KIL84_002397 [Mauremys mutica]|uniref:Uncharacterized protein n=1 Tax=Mauremys mutica TaxID=74926 RepID=A0A9D4AXJ4_9SAUR|nr:hypothetical protein KIL84_002397 [Mauremys mutica]
MGPGGVRLVGVAPPLSQPMWQPGFGTGWHSWAPLASTIPPLFQTHASLGRADARWEVCANRAHLPTPKNNLHTDLTLAPLMLGARSQAVQLARDRDFDYKKMDLSRFIKEKKIIQQHDNHRHR